MIFFSLYFEFLKIHVFLWTFSIIDDEQGDEENDTATPNGLGSVWHLRLLDISLSQLYN